MRTHNHQNEKSGLLNQSNGLMRNNADAEWLSHSYDLTGHQVKEVETGKTVKLKNPFSLKPKLMNVRWVLLSILLLIVGAGGAWAQVGGLTHTGDMTVCLNATEQYGVMTTAGSTYSWTLIAGTGGNGTIFNGLAPNNLISILWTTLGTCTLEVTEHNSNGCEAVINSILITVVSLPVPTITGPSPICLNSTGNVYTTEAGMTNYLWTVTGGTITAGGTPTSNTVTVTWTGAARSVSVNYTNGTSCTAAAPAVFDVTINTLPVPTISAVENPVCFGNTGTYTTEPGMTGYVWVVVGGITTAGGTTADNTVTIIWSGTGPYSVSVNYRNTNGCTAVAPAVYNVTVTPLPITSPIYHN